MKCLVGCRAKRKGANKGKQIGKSLQTDVRILDKKKLGKEILKRKNTKRNLRNLGKGNRRKFQQNCNLAWRWFSKCAGHVQIRVVKGQLSK